MQKQSFRANIWKLGGIILSNDSSFGLGVFIIYMLWVSLTLAEASLVISSWLVFSSIGQTPSGIFADRYGYKTAITAGSVLVFVGTLIFATGHGFIALLLGYSLIGFGAAMKQGADHALLYEGMKQEESTDQFKRTVGRLDFFTNIFWVIAAIIGGFMFVSNPRLPFYAETVIAGIGTVIAVFLREPPRSSRHFPIMQQIRSSIEHAFKKPRFSKIFLFSALIGSVALMTFQYVQPLYKELGIPEAHFGILAAIFFLFRGFGSWSAEKVGQIFSIDKYLVLHAATFGLFLVLIQRMESTFYVLPVLAVFYFLRGLYAPTVSTYINDKVTSNERATMLSINQQFLTAVTALSVSGLGILADRFGLPYVFFSISTISLSFLILYVLSLRTVEMD